MKNTDIITPNVDRRRSMAVSLVKTKIGLMIAAINQAEARVLKYEEIRQRSDLVNLILNFTN